MSLSLCMIVRNEAVNLPSCLDSVKSVVDEMVVLDTGSTDETPAIARNLGAQVHHFTWCDDFSAARNESLKYAQGDWILVLDADEVLVADIVPMLEQAIQQDDYLVVNLVRQEVGAAQSPYSLVSRLFRRHPDIHFTRPYHAMVDDSVGQLLSREPWWRVVELPDVAILHNGYQAAAIAERDKFQKAQIAMERFLVSHPGDPYACSKLGALYVQMNRLSHGIELLERGLRAAQVTVPVLYELHYHLAIAYTRLSNLVEAERHYQVAIQQPILPRLKLGAYNNLGNLLKARRELTGAKAVYEACLEVDPDFAMGHYNLGMTLKAMGQMVEAIAHYEQAIHLNPGYAEAYQNLGVVLLKVGKVAESLAAFSRAIVLHRQHDPQEAERLQQGLEQMGFRV